MKKLLVVLSILLTSLCMICCLAETRESQPSPPHPVHLLLKWFTGEFNNYEQNQEEIYASKQGENIEPHHHIHSIFAPVELPLPDSYAFHVQQSAGDQLDQIFRQRVYVFKPNKDQTISMKIYKYADPEKWVNIHLHPEKLVAFDVSTLIDTGCQIIWEKDGEMFTGVNEGGKCTTYSEHLKKNIVVEDTISLFQDQIWLLDNVYDEERNLIMGRSDGEPAKLKRCVFYRGWAAIQENVDLKQHTGDTPPPDPSKSNDRKYKGYYKLEFHNQGKTVVLKDKDGTKSGYDLSLCQVTYAGSQTPVLKLGLHKTGQKGTVYYIWAEPDAELLGMNLTWLQAGVTKETDKLFGKEFTD